MNQLQGKIFTYNKLGSIAFTNCIKSDFTIVFIGGLGDSILNVPFIPILNQFCKQYCINLTIPQLRSMPNYRVCTIDQDIQDMKELFQTIKTNIILIGHSTGCQDALLFIKSGYSHQKIKAIVLQAPVSDVQYQLKIDQNLQVKIKEAKQNPSLIYQGKAWLSERFLSLYQKNNKQDLFSSYLPTQQFIGWKCQIPLISIISQKDLQFSDNVDKVKLGSQLYVIKQGSHQLSDQKCQQQFINILKKEFGKLGFIKQIC